jgi:hypothetical protein
MLIHTKVGGRKFLGGRTKENDMLPKRDLMASDRVDRNL